MKEIVKWVIFYLLGMYFITETTVGSDFKLTTTGKPLATRLERSTEDPN
jgi:hypothetical protein